MCSRNLCKIQVQFVFDFMTKLFMSMNDNVSIMNDNVFNNQDYYGYESMNKFKDEKCVAQEIINICRSDKIDWKEFPLFSHLK